MLGLHENIGSNFCGHAFLTEGMSVTQLSNKAGISV
jgi:hypothetical protein